MPSIVFPAPGCESGRQYLMSFQGFDISHDTGGTFTNLVTNSIDLTKSDWIRGVDNQAVLGESRFDIVADYINESDTLPYQPIYAYKNEFGEHTIVSSSSTQYYGQQIPVLPSTDYTFSFYAKRGTATNTTYGIYNVTNNVDIVSATSYYANTSQTLWSRISSTFNTGSATTINAFVLWNIATGSPGSVNIFGPQLDLGTSAKDYDPTGSISWASQGLTTVAKQSYGRSQLASFSDPAKDFEPITINGQSSARWQVVNDYIFDNPTLRYVSAGTNNVLSIPEQTARPYQIGDTVTVANSNTGYRQNFQVTEFTTRSLTINTTNAMPVNGSFVVNAAPQVYPQSLTSVAQYRSTGVSRENLFAVTFAPNLRGIEYFLDRDFVTTAAVSNAEFKLSNLKVRGVNDRRSVAKVLPRTNVHTPVDRRSVAKVLPRTNVHTPVDRRSTSRTETLTATGSSLISRFPNGMPALTGTNLFLSLDRTAADVILTNNSFRLESFDNQGIYPGDIFNVAGQNNVKNNIINQHIYDLDVLSVTVSANGAQQTLYFTTSNAYYPVRYFPVGFYVRINDSIGNTSYIVQVASSTASSITFNTIAGFPNRISGQGLTIQSATSFVYPKTKVDSDMYAYMSANGINLYNYPTNARENLSVSEVKPNFRAVTQIYLEGSLGDTLPVVYSTTGAMSTFDAGIIPGDFKITVTGQSANNINNAVIWYRNELDILTLTPSVPGLNTAYFPVQDAVPYPTGTQVRLVNIGSGFNQIATVVTGTSNSISFNGTLPVGGTTIERIVSSVYPQQYVTTTTAPTTARENLFYSTLAVGYRSNSSITQGRLFATDNNALNTLKLNAASVVKSVFTTPLSNNLEKPITTLRSTRNLPTVSKLSSAIKVLPDRASFNVQRITNFYQQSSVVVTGAPTNARENLYYFNLAPGYRSNSSIVQGKLFESGYQTLLVNNLNKQLAVLKTDQNSLPTGKLKAVQVLISDRTHIATSLIEKLAIKSNATEVFFTPYVDKVSQGFVVRSDLTTISADNLNKQLFVLKPDQNILVTNKLSSTTVLRTDTINLNADKLEPFKVRFDATEVFETPLLNNLELQIARLTSGDVDFNIESINKQLSILRADQSRLATDKLSTAAVIKSDNVVLSSSTLDKRQYPLVGYSNIINYSLLDKFTVRSDSTEVFNIHNSNFLNKGFIVKDSTVNVSNAFIVNKGLVVRGENTVFDLTLLDKFTMPADKSQVFYEPQMGKLSAAIVVRQSTETARIGRLTAAVKVVAETNRFSVYSPDNYSDQSIYNNLNPNNSAISKFQYFNIAPGFRYNSSIQQGLSYEPPASKIKLESLATFDNVGLTTDPYISAIFTTDPVFPVTGRTSNVTTNSILWYIDDLDILTVLPVGTPTVTLYFFARDWLPAPIPSGTQIVIKYLTGYTKTVSVISSDAGSVTIVDPGDLPSINGITIARTGIGHAVTVYFSTRINPPYPVGSYITLINNQNNTRATEQVTDCGLNYVTYIKSVDGFNLPQFDNATIASASVSIIPKSTVVTNIAPTTPREYLYYAELARGYKYGVLNTAFGSSLSDESPANIKSQFLERDYYRLKGLPDPDTVRNLELELFKLAQPSKRDLTIEFLELLKTKDYKNQVFDVDKGGRIIRFKTGNFKTGSTGITDVAAPKKEPIQFWN